MTGRGVRAKPSVPYWSDAAALGDGGIVPRLLTSTLGGGLSAWAHAVRGDSETWLCRLLLGTRKVAVAVAPGKAEDGKAISALSDATKLEVTTPTGSRHLSPQVAAALLSKVRTELTSRQAQIVDLLKRQCPGFAEMRKLVLGFRRQAGHPASLDGAGTKDRYPFAGSLCADFETGPSGSGIGSEHAVEQRAGGRTHKPAQNAKAANVWTCRYRIAPRSPTTRARIQ
jgi:hypothetical protein